VFAFLWHDIQHCSPHYHPEGSILVIAADLGDARELILATIGAHCEALNMEPTRVWTVDEPSARELFVFPNAGCCRW
jgi:hypothetical protein